MKPSAHTSAGSRRRGKSTAKRLQGLAVSGQQHGQLTQQSYAKKVYAHEIGGKLMSAIQITTAAGMCAMVDLLVDGKLPKKGFVRQEQADLKAFLGNRFGKVYA